ncbi:hypothetical protein B7486_38405 [cyanobacterium TDX16]|nr:hypothetical protein B7486_38405 [cyanobacterium TDX16]
MSILELPFWLGLLLWSLLPATRTPWFTIESIPISSQDIVIIIVTCFYALLPAIDKRPIINTIHKHWHGHLPILTVAIVLYAALSVTWSEMRERDTIAMLYTLVLTASGFSLGYNLVVKRSSDSVRPFLWRLTVYLALLGLLYSAASLLTLSVADVRADTENMASEFGIPRVGGPLFIASTGYFILIPALSFAIQELIRNPARRLFKAVVIFALMLTNIGMGSRGALIVIGAFLLSLIFSTKKKKQAIVAALVMIIAVTVSAWLFFSQANTERLQSLDDDSRTETYLTSFDIISHRSTELNFLGSGYGSYWHWYLPDVEAEGALKSGEFFISTPFGDMLYNPHSTFLLLIVELGTVGLAFFLFLWSTLLRVLLKNLTFPIFASGIFASGIAMFFDCFLFKNAQLNTLWWIFLFGALALKVNKN